ncbi:HAD domain-containing protein [Noviherbaspirillum malthae]|uniref:HAD domain-containing protein n=1 Tax=Noviherbaspirillum malthae TaxID=1260987 RepID=UPI00188F5E41|nr:HAD domain-containing protein [Noviherbaspirillum malthae]
MDKLLTADKVLYLDFDGVLHHENVLTHPYRGTYIAAPGRMLFEWMPILEALLASHPDVAIVLSTSWVLGRSFDFAKSRLSSSLQKRVIGATFNHRLIRKDEFSLLSRGQQVAEDVSRREPKSWFAIDDEELGWPAWCRDKLIRTDGAVGISNFDVQHSVRKRLDEM